MENLQSICNFSELNAIPGANLNQAVEPSQPKSSTGSNENIVVIAQTATKVAKDFDYTALLEILPVLSEHDEFKSAIDSIHKQLFPLYEKELILKFGSEIDEHLEQCKKFGEKLILDSKIIKDHQEKYFMGEKKEVHQKTDEARTIEKTHSWKELKDEF